MILTFELGDWVKPVVLTNVGGPHPISWRLSRTNERPSSCQVIFKLKYWFFLLEVVQIGIVSASWFYSSLWHRLWRFWTSQPLFPQLCEPVSYYKSLSLSLYGIFSRRITPHNSSGDTWGQQHFKKHKYTRPTLGGTDQWQSHSLWHSGHWDNHTNSWWSAFCSEF